MKKKAVAYCRVSTKEQKDKGFSIEGQELAIKNYCNRHNIEIVEIFCEDHSAKNFERPTYTKLYKYLKLHKAEIDFLLVHKWDRFSRNILGSYAEIDKIRALGIEINAVDNWVDHSIPESSYILGFQIISAEVENTKISTRTKFGTRQALRSGRFVNRPPIGYSSGKDSSGKSLIKPHPELSSLVKQLLEDYSTGNYSQQEILKTYKPKGLNINTSTLSRLLTNVLYMGKVVLPAHKDEPEMLITGLHEPLINEDVFYRIQRIKNGGKNLKKYNKANNPFFPLTGFLTCPNCGNRMYGSVSNNGKSKKHTRTYYYYQCNSGNKCPMYTNEILHTALIKELKRVKPSRGITQVLESMLISEYKNTNNERVKQLERTNILIQEKEDLRSKLTLMLAQRNIEQIDYNNAITSIKKDIMILEANKTDFNNYQKDLDKFVNFGISLMVNMESLFTLGNVDTKKKILGSIFSDKLIFEKNCFRTLPFNEAISLFSRYNKDFESLGKKKGGTFKGSSHSVPGVGIEPTHRSTRV
jgi:site-specific DNA recombinase